MTDDLDCLEQFPMKDGNTLEDKNNELKNSLISQSQVKYSVFLIVANLKNKIFSW